MLQTERLIFSFHDGLLYWNIWKTDYGWHNKMPRWQDGSFNFADFFLGKNSYSTKVLEEKDIEVKMPEGTYNGIGKLVEARWKRPRWFENKIFRAELDIPEGIPIPGKGENSYDCGPDATYGMTCPADTIHHGVNELIKSCINTRLKRCGSIDYSERGTE